MRGWAEGGVKGCLGGVESEWRMGCLGRARMNGEWSGGQGGRRGMGMEAGGGRGK